MTGRLLVVCSSYNGTPPDNAAAFCKEIPQRRRASSTACSAAAAPSGRRPTRPCPPASTTGWPRAGGAASAPRGEGNAAADFDAAYRNWHEGLWADVAGALGLPPDIAAAVAAAAPTGPRLAITLTNRQVTNPVIMSYRARPTRVLANRELIRSANGKPAERSTRHVEIALPAGTTYQAGDHLGVLPRNGIDLIRRVMARFGLDAGQYLTIIPNSGSHTHLPIDEPAPLLGVLASCVELQDVATRDDIATLADHTDDPAQQAALRDRDVENHVPSRCWRPTARCWTSWRRSRPATCRSRCTSTCCPPLRPRYYSISSSPLVGGDVCSITVGVLRGPCPLGHGHVHRHRAPGYLAVLPTDGTVFAFVRSPSIAFRPPANPHTPMIMVGAGTGFAPFRGFLQERAALKGQGVPVERSLLFFGCRDRAADYLYADELRGWEADGIVRVEGAFSRTADAPSRYVQDALLDCADEVWELLQHDAAVFVCGNAATMAPGVRSALITIFRDKTSAGEADAAAWLAGLRTTDRFLEDIWGG